MLKAISNSGTSSPGGGVTSLQAETGDITLTSSGNTVTITTPTSSTINLEASAGGAVAFNAVTSGTNIAAAMVVGSGASLGASGTGTVTATAVAGTGITGTTLASNIVNTSITQVGTISTGTWQGTIISPTYGGTGINNGSSTITIGGNVLFSTTHTFTAVLTGDTNVTFPTSGTLSTTTGTVTTTGSPANGSLTKFSGGSSITNGDLSGDVTTSGTLATTVAKIAGTTVSGTTGSTNVVFSGSPTITTPALNGTPTGTGVATTATASTLALRDSNANIFYNNSLQNGTKTTSAGGTTILTAASSRYQALTGSSSQTYQLPDATTLSLGPWFTFNNNSSGSLIITNNGGSTLYTVPAGGIIQTGPTDISTANGAWDFHGYFPGTITWGSGITGLVFNTALSTTPSINAGASSSTSPSFIPQRGSSTTGFGGDSTHLYGIIGGTAEFTSTATAFNIPSGSVYQINGVQIAASDVGLGNVTNDTQTKAAIIPNTAPSAGQILVGNAGGTAYAPGTVSGDATLSSAGALTVGSNKITYAKMQQASTLTLLGNPTGITANVSEITLGSGLSFSGTTLTATGGGTGTVTTTGTPASGNLTAFSGSTSITNGDLSGDVTTSGTLATTVAKIAGVAVGTPTGTTNVVFSNGPTLSNPIVGTQSSADNSTKAASTAYVTTAITNALNGLDWKPAVGYATTANVVGTNTAGVFTYTSTGVDTIDGHQLALNDVVLFKNQTTGADNGVWVVTTAGAIGVAGVLTRRSDYNTAADIHQGDTFYVINGTANAGTSWVQTAIVTTINTDALAFTQVAGPGTYTAGNGLSLTGNSFAIDTSITVDKTTAQTLTNKTLTSPTLTTPALGTPASGVLTNCTGTASGLTAGTVTTNANLTGAVTSSGNATTLITSLSFSAGSATSTSNQTYELVSKAAFGGTINGILGGKTVSGSVTVAIKIGATSVTGLSAVSLTSTPADTNASAANTFATGDDITAVFSSGSSDLGAAFTLKVTRT